MNKGIILTLIVILVGSAFYLVTLRTTLQSKQPVKSDERLNIMLIGDVGTGDENQWAVARKMNEIAAQKNSKFVLSFGDNFYERGVSGLDDPQWKTAYSEVYPTLSYLKDLPWYGLMGNHDFYGDGLFSEFEYQENNWYTPDFFWSHTDQVGDKKIAFLHMDTNFLAYGPEGAGGENMGIYFQELGWKSDEDVLALAEEQLLLYQDYDYVFAMGHHHIGHVCYANLNAWKLYDLLQEYKASAYFNGHSHTLAFKIQDEMGMIVSGAGAKSRHNECIDLGSDPYWSMGYIFGFVNIEVLEDEIEVVAYYIDDELKNGWKTKSLPSIKRRERF